MSSIKAAFEMTDDAPDNSSAFDGRFFLLLVFALALRLFQSLNTEVIDIDSYRIIIIVKALASVGSLSLSDLAVNVHPLFPLLLVLIGKCGIGYEAAGKTISILFGTFTLFPVYLMSKRAYGRTVGRYSAFLFAVHPYLFINASNLLRDSMNIFFVVMTFFIAWKGFEEKKDRYLVLAGCTAALAYMTKAEGLFSIIAVLLYIWMRDPRGKKVTLRQRVLSTISFASVSFIAAVVLIVVFSLKTHAFSVTLEKSLSLSSFYTPPAEGAGNELASLGGISTGLYIADKILAFFFEFFEAVFTVYILLLGLNLVRIWTGKRPSGPERYCIFILVALLALDFCYFSLTHILSRRYFLSVVVLLMGLTGYGMRLLQAWTENVFKKYNGPILLRRTIVVLFIVGMIVSGLIKGSYYWRTEKASLKIAGRYILSHSGAGRTILTDDERVAYYADGASRPLSEEALSEAVGAPAGGCPYDYIVFAHDKGLSIYKKHARAIAERGFIIRTIALPPGSDTAIVLECPKKR